VWRVPTGRPVATVPCRFRHRGAAGAGQADQSRGGSKRQLAVAEERVRIARELHDIVAHGVSLMTIPDCRGPAGPATQPEAAEQSLQAAEDTGRQSLAQLQGMLSMLRGADASIGAAGRGRRLSAGRRRPAALAATPSSTARPLRSLAAEIPWSLAVSTDHDGPEPRSSGLRCAAGSAAPPR